MNLRNNAIYGLQIAAFCLLASPTLAAPLQDWRFDPSTNQLEVTVKNGVKPRYSFMARPARIVLELPGTEVGKVKTQETYTGSVRQITLVQDRPGITQIILELAPTTVLSKEQLEFRQVAESDQTSDRWILRPLVATAPKPIFSSVRTTPQPSAPGIQTTPSGPNYPPGLSPEETATTPQAGSELPPVSVKPAPKNAPGQFTTPVVPKAEIIPPPQATPSISQIPSNNLPLSEVNPSLAIPESLPPVTPAPPTSTPTVNVPPLNRAEPQNTVAPFQIPDQATQSIPNSASFPIPNQAVQSIPNSTSFPIPNQSSAPTPARPQQIAQNPSSVIDFGQPLFNGSNQPIPNQPYNPIPNQPIPNQPYNPNVLLPAGTVLNLRYAGFQPLKLQNNQPRQEVLVLQNEIRDRNGYVLIPPGASVFGNFETGGAGSRFVAQGISYQGRNVRLMGQSDALAGNRQVADNRLLRNSGIGALAGAILGGFSGGTVLGGAAVGAGVTYAIAPRPATIQPGQIIQLKLTEDLR